MVSVTILFPLEYHLSNQIHVHVLQPNTHTQKLITIDWLPGYAELQIRQRRYTMWTVHWLHTSQVWKVHKLPGQSKLWKDREEEAGMPASKMHAIRKLHSIYKEGTGHIRTMLICWSHELLLCHSMAGNIIGYYRYYKQLGLSNNLTSNCRYTTSADNGKVSASVIIVVDIKIAIECSWMVGWTKKRVWLILPMWTQALTQSMQSSSSAGIFNSWCGEKWGRWYWMMDTAYSEQFHTSFMEQKTDMQQCFKTL